MLPLHRAILVLLLLLKPAEGQSDDYTVICPLEDVLSLTMAGLDAGNRLVNAWQQVYKSKYCPNMNITFESNSWDASAARVCGSSLIYDAVDIASMAGSFFQPQASTSDGWSFQCKRSKLERQTALILAGLRGIIVGTSKQGAAAQCIELLGGGLSKDQLRWIYSSLSTRELIANGWDPSSVPYLDGDDNTHLWSEIHENCTETEILLAVEETGKSRDDAMSYVFDHILRSRGEVMRDYFSSATSQLELDEYLNANGAAIAILHLYDALSTEFQEHGIMAVGIKNEDGDVIMPFAKLFEEDKYPFLKKITLGFVNDPVSLLSIRPFLEFGYSAEGTQILKQLGYWPIAEWKKLGMYTRFGSDLGLPLPEIQKSCGPSERPIAIAGGNTVLPVIRIWSEMYQLGCTEGIKFEGGRSADGADRICASAESGYSVDVGLMARNFDPTTEAIRRRKNDFVYDCLREKDDDELRSVIQVEAALEGITIILSIGSVGEKCVRLLGGLTMDQLRWMYSSYSDAELEKSGWDPNSLANNDFDPSTHLWSELDHRCAEEEIQLVGDTIGEGSFVGFSELLLTDFAKGEHIATNRPKPYVEAYGVDVLSALLQHNDAVSYGEYSVYFVHHDVFWAAPLATQAGVPFVIPSEVTFADGSYPLWRSLYLNVQDNDEVLRRVIPFLQFGYSHPALIRLSGFAPLSADRAEEMLRRLNNGPYTFEGAYDEDDEIDQNNVGLIMGIIIGTGVVVALIIIAIRYWRQ